MLIFARWLDITPVSRVIARCTQDMRAGRLNSLRTTWRSCSHCELVDDEIAALVQKMSRMTISMLAKCIAIVIVTPAFILPSALVALLGALLGQIYLAIKLWAKRETSNARAPVLAHLQAALQGLREPPFHPVFEPRLICITASIRAYNAQRAFVHESYRLIEKYTRIANTTYNLNRWAVPYFRKARSKWRT